MTTTVGWGVCTACKREVALYRGKDKLFHAVRHYAPTLDGKAIPRYAPACPGSYQVTRYRQGTLPMAKST